MYTEYTWSTSRYGISWSVFTPVPCPDVSQSWLQRVDWIFLGSRAAVAGTSRKSECFKTETQETYYKASENGSLFTRLTIFTLLRIPKKCVYANCMKNVKMRFADFRGCASLTAGNLISNFFASRISAYPDSRQYAKNENQHNILPVTYYQNFPLKTDYNHNIQRSIL